ncbi:hypothetical protein [Myroides odoratimimus]|uniref:hypothetical protein n=1 Tax=Myroides odoratimimus TaxID=76832 RepID=UPI002577A47D|nr:hypothetical protein [Myroides odoratimimus]MDM1535061.1 hypothetical protein [Myroides odoratimimus]MDM1674181.1 hypothetical protein [Myroides odoratimimus]
MAKKKVDILLSDHVMVEVVMKKEMTIGAYRKLLENDKGKGWRVQAYQLGVYSPGLREEVK